MTQPALPLVSIIVPTFNRLTLLNRLIESLESQTYQNIEIVIINNGSSDGTREYLDQTYAQNGKYVIVHFDKNSGSPMACYNEGILRANGEYLGIIYDDDTLTPDAISFLVEMAIEHNSPWVVANCIDTTTGDFSFHGVKHNCTITFKDMITEEYQGESWALFKKQLINGLHFDENMYGGESSVWLKMYKRSNALYFHRGVRIYYTQHGDNICSVKNIIKNIDKMIYTDRRYLEEFNQDFEKHGMLNSRYYRLGLLMALKGDKTESFRQIGRYLSPEYVFKLIFHLCIMAFPTSFVRQMVILRSWVFRKG